MNILLSSQNRSFPTQDSQLYVTPVPSFTKHIPHSLHWVFMLGGMELQSICNTPNIRIMMGCRSRDSCRKLFNLEILPLPSQYILCLLFFTITNKNQSQVNSEIHQTNTRQHANLHQPSVNATKYQKGVHCIGVKVFNMLPFYIKADSDDIKKFKELLQKYLHENSFYSLDKYSECQVKFWHMIWIDTWGPWDKCSFFLRTSLYYKYVSIYPTTICNEGKFPT